MKISNFKKSALRNAQVALTANEEELVSTMKKSDGPGTENNPYSLWDMCEMVHNGTWKGGYVLITGNVSYVGRYSFAVGSEEHDGSDYTLYPSEFNFEEHYNKTFSFIKPSSNFVAPSADQASSEFSYTGSNLAIAGKDYAIYHEKYRYSDACTLSFEQKVDSTTVYVCISTFSECIELNIPAIKCAISTESNFVTQEIYAKRNSSQTIRANTAIARFGYYRLKGEQVMLIFDNDNSNPIGITTY